MFEHEGDTKSALDNWRRLFPHVFPTQVDIAVSKARSVSIKGADALRMLVNPK